MVPWREFVDRFMIGHLVAYPAGMIAAIGAMPFAMRIREDELLSAGATGTRWTLLADATADMGLTATEVAQLEVVLEGAVLVSLVALVVVHLAAIPWSVAAARAAQVERDGGEPATSMQRAHRAKRWFWWVTGALGATMLVIGIGGWAWLLVA